MGQRIQLSNLPYNIVFSLSICVCVCVCVCNLKSLKMTLKARAGCKLSHMNKNDLELALVLGLETCDIINCPAKTQTYFSTQQPV